MLPFELDLRRTYNAATAPSAISDNGTPAAAAVDPAEALIPVASDEFAFRVGGVGFTVGELDGNFVGLDVGGLLGVTDGDTVGTFDGWIVGECDGARVGIVEGANEGKREGNEVGATVGIPVVGSKVGKAVGLSLCVGLADGYVGLVEGELDGTRVGFRVGLREGANVGVEVGPRVGARVGTNDGDFETNKPGKAAMSYLVSLNTLALWAEPDKPMRLPSYVIEGLLQTKTRGSSTTAYDMIERTDLSTEEIPGAA